MTSDTPDTTTAADTAADTAAAAAGDAAVAAAPAKPPRRRATRKAAAPATPDTPADAPADPSAVVPSADVPVDVPIDTGAGAAAGTSGALAPVEAPVEAAAEAPPARATRSRRATSAATADGAPAPKRATRSRAAKAPVADAGPAADAAQTGDAGRTADAGSTADAGPTADPGPTVGAPSLDVFAEFGRARTAAPAAVPAPEPDLMPEPVPTPGPEVVDEAVGDLIEEPTVEVVDEAVASAAPEPVEAPEPRLATTALLFQPPEPTATRPRRRRVIAPAGPPQFIVPEVISPPPVAPVADAAPALRAADADADATAEPRRRGRRATRSAAAPAPLTDLPVTEVAEAVELQPSPDAEADAEVELPAVTTSSRRGSRRRGSRAAQPAGSTTVAEDATDDDTDASEEHVGDPSPLLDGPDATGALDVVVPDGIDEDDEDDVADEDDAAEGGAPRRRRRRGGRGRRSRSGGEGEGPRAPVDEAEAGEDDEEDDVVGRDAEGQDGDTETDDAAADTGEGDEVGGSSRRRRRRRRSGRGGDAGEVEVEASPSTRTARPARTASGAASSGTGSSTGSDEVTALRGSTRLEAKRQRRREGRDAGRRGRIITESEFLARRESVDRTMVVREVDGRTQIAVLEDGVLVEHYVSRQAQVSMAGNVYLGRVQNVLPSMEAAFIDVGKGRNAVLYAGEVNWDAAGLEGQPRRIEQALKSGDSVLVQVTKDPIGHKGARLTSQITLAGRYLVYVPSGGMTGISRKLPDNERARLKKLLREIVPDTAGVIVRTAAEGASEDELRADILRLQEQWTAIEKKAKTASAPALLQGEPDLAIRVVRDIFNDDFSSLVVQGDEAWATISGYIGALAPDLADKVSRWTSESDVFTAHRVDEQLAKGMDRKVWLPSGGSLVIDRTEAMTVVDVNTGKFTGSGGTLEETVTRNNLEAAEEIVRQLRLRDIGGIIVIDFIDMVLELNRDLVLRRLVECLGRDRTKHQVAEVTSLGLVQMTRKRVGQGLVEAFSETCEHCNGRGFIVHTDPIERGGAPVVQVQTPQPPVGGDARQARRRRTGGPEQAPAAPSGLPMVPVLPQAREAVKATLATIAAAAAHAHEHEHAAHAHGHGQDGAQSDARSSSPSDGQSNGGGDGQDGRREASAVPGAASALFDLPTAREAGADPSPSGSTQGASHDDVTAAVTEALAAIRLPEPAGEPRDGVGAVVEEVPEVVVDAVTDEALEAAADEGAGVEAAAEVHAVVEDVLETVAEAVPDGVPASAPDVSPADVVDPAADAVVDEALELLPVGPEVFDAAGTDESTDEATHEVTDEQVTGEPGPDEQVTDGQVTDEQGLPDEFHDQWDVAPEDAQPHQPSPADVAAPWSEGDDHGSDPHG